MESCQELHRVEQRWEASEDRMVRSMVFFFLLFEEMIKINVDQSNKLRCWGRRSPYKKKDAASCGFRRKKKSPMSMLKRPAINPDWLLSYHGIMQNPMYSHGVV